MASDLKKELLELLERDREFRLSVAGLLGYKEILEELKRLREDMHRGFEEHSRRFDENDRKFNEILERLDRHEAHLTEHDRKFNEILERLDEHDRKFNEVIERLNEHDRKFNEVIKRLDEHDRKFNEVIERLNEHDRKFNEILEELKLHREKLEEHDFKFDSMMRKLDALGARWGILAENAFREGMRRIVERLFGGSVERWIHDDREGFVFGYPATVEVDIVIRDGEHILVEIKSHVRKSDVGVLLRKGKLYKKVRGITPRLVFVSPYIDEDARSDAEMLGIEAYNA
ncbi:MAG: DUF3782 domain-containing protein [Candidatus Methanospirare jalkutatii]|nr:DUF3782 domain-containing protein [Candidatus Methanospirare jalkutatii]